MQHLITMLLETLDETVSARIPDGYPADTEITVIDIIGSIVNVISWV